MGRPEAISPLIEVLRAADYAARLHAGQRRKGELQEPYLNHLIEVADAVGKATAGEDPSLVVAALLHDIVEDTPASLDDVAGAFGRDVADLVAELTDDKSLKKAERKSAQVENAHAWSGRAKILKIGDATSNLKALFESPPVGWDLERRVEYFEWAAAVVEGCRGASAELERGFDEAYSCGMAALEREAAAAER
jgi:(p)ppGpp synthase/HD superfamily hydrolase